MTNVSDCGDYTLILTGYDPYSSTLRMPFSVVPTGNEDNPYMIYTVEQWNSFANNVNHGYTYSGKFFKLMSNINVTEMVGGGDGSNKVFSGTFDGNGHTLFFYIENATEQYIAPFRRIDGATIKNLKLQGTVSSSNRFAGGIVAYTKGTSTVINCSNSTNITSTYSSSNASNGGIVGMVGGNGTINITGCVFNGQMSGTTSDGTWCGILGLCNDSCTANISNCFIDPVSSVTGGNTIYRSNGTTNCSYCYYSKTIGNAQGKYARSITGGTDVNVELIGEAVEYNVSGITAYIYEGYPMQGIKKDGVIYAASNEIVGLEMQYIGSQTPTGEHQNAHYSANNATIFSNWSSIYLYLDNSNNNVVLNFVGFDYAFEGNGTENEPYEIHCLEQWNLLAYQVNNGIRQYIDMYFKLMTDLTVEETFSGTPTTQVGKDLENPFCGIFDGNGHTITVNYTDNSSHDYCAPFRVIEGATIKNLHVTGSITKTDNKNAAGIVGQALNTCHIIDCRSSVTIFFNDGGDCSSGGIVGDVRQNMYLPATSNLYLTNCAFDGKLVSGDGDNIATNWGGLVGWVNETADAYFENCLFVPQRVDGRIGQYDDTGSRTFARGDGDLHFTNCYYTKYIRGNQGKQAYSITTGECVTVDNAGTPSTTSTTGAIGYGTGVKFNGVLYAASGEIQSLNLSNTPNPGYVADSYIVSGGTLSGSANPYTLTMPNADVIISLAVAEWEGTGTEDDPYLIYVNRQWELLATRVNNPGTNEEAQQGYSGKFFKLMNDLTFDSKNTMTMLGNSEHSFCGTFDGNGHTLTVNLSSGVNYCAPFRFVNGATIKHLHVAGFVGISRGITDLTSHIKYAGVVGRATGNCNLIDCHSSLKVSSEDVYFGSLSEAYDSNLGGFIGEVASGTVNMDGCVYDGRMTIQREIAIGWGGFIGWIAGNNDAHANITNCLFAPKEIQLTNVSSSRTFARGYNDSDVTVTNSYYTQTLGTAQGKQAHSITGAENVIVAFAGDATENEVSGITSYANSLGILYDNGTIITLIAGNEDAVSLNLTASDGYVIGTGTVTYTPEGGTATEIIPVEGVYSFTMPDANVTINAPLIVGYTLEVEGYGNSNGGWKLIASPLAESIAPTVVTNLVAENATDFDLYRFNQAAEMEWENWKKDTLDHYHFDLEPGKGYLYASKEDVTLVFPGTPYNSTGEVTLDYTDDNSNEDMRGWNLVGNSFITTATLDQPYYRMNAQGSALNTETENTPVAAMEGVFVKATTANQKVTFTAQTRGGEQAAIAQANIMFVDDNGTFLDNAILRFDGGQTLEKFSFSEGSTKIYLPQDGTDYAIINAEKQGEMPLNFKAKEDGTYSLTVNPEGVEMAYLHLIDNMTGADVDLLVAPSYTFTAKTTDYESRFRLVFSNCGDAIGDNGAFAFISNGNIIVTSEGTLQIIDMTGRIVISRDGACTVSTNGMVPGVYVLRLINGNDVKTQKIIIQ